MSYLLVTFPLAVVWHLVLFKGIYEEIGYIGREEPLFALGFLSILIQGFVMAAAFPVAVRRRRSIKSGICYALLVGLFFWTSHVLAFAAKGDVAKLEWFIPMESLYLLIQFGVLGLILGASFGKWSPGVAQPQDP